MRPNRTPLLLAAASGMELSWRFAWAHYTTVSLFHRTFPLPLAAGVLLAALLVTGLSRDRGWRVVQVLALQTVGLAAAAVLFVYAEERSTFPLWDLQWLSASWSRQREIMEWVEGGAALFWGGVFWTGGVFLARRPTFYLNLCTRFDVGLAAFFVLFTVRWLVRANGGPDLVGPAGELFLASYFAFALFAVGLARLRGTEPTRFASERRGVGLLLSAAAGAVLLGTATTLLFLPQLTAAVGKSYGVLRAVGEPVGAILLRVLAFVFVGRRAASRIPGGSGEQGLKFRWEPAGSSGGSGWEQFVYGMLQWGLGAIVAVLLAAAVALALWKLARWLLSRTSQRELETPRGTRPSVFHAIVLFLLAFVARTLGWKKDMVSAARLYAGLRAWGLRGGVATNESETPLEYARRLARQFPSVKREIDLIVDLHVQEVYGGRAFDRPQLTAAARARGRLSSPLLWPRRLRSWLLPAAQGRGAPRALAPAQAGRPGLRGASAHDVSPRMADGSADHAGAPPAQ